MGNFLVIQWLGLSAFTPVALSSIPGQGNKLSQALQQRQKRVNGCGATLVAQW